MDEETTGIKMKDWKKLLPKIPEIAENFIENWKKYDTPRNRDYLAYGKETLEKCLEQYFLLRDEWIHPNIVKRILKRALKISGDIELAVLQAYNEWCLDKDEDWEYDHYHSAYIENIEWCLQNCWSWGYRIEVPEKPTGERGRPKKAYPIEEIERLKREGLRIREIAKKLGLPYSAVQRTLKKLK